MWAVLIFTKLGFWSMIEMDSKLQLEECFFTHFLTICITPPTICMFKEAMKFITWWATCTPMLGTANTTITTAIMKFQEWMATLTQLSLKDFISQVAS